MGRHVLTIEDCSRKEILALFERATVLKRETRAGKPHLTLAGKTLAMIFEKPSTRTRLSFEVGMFQLGGHAIHLASSTSQLERGETYSDTARVMSRYVDGILIRTFHQQSVVDMAQATTIPIINGLTDRSHPCQVLTDLFTVVENFGVERLLRDGKIAYVGDGNNMANSWIEAALVLGFPLAIATPQGYEPDAELLQRITAGSHRHISIGHDPQAAVRDAIVVNTDTWVSMGQEGERTAQKKEYFAPFQVNRALMQLAHREAIVLHCLPAHREEEITSEVMDGPQSRIFDQAENRLHLQKALLEQLMAR
ncbi:MAG: ornithine carbamoyltransferase [Deltaproteobacteria bacterium]|nr:ornithine carbamoyltransferase [Deltaproteobacteria bacterium]